MNDEDETMIKVADSTRKSCSQCRCTVCINHSHQYDGAGDVAGDDNDDDNTDRNSCLRMLTSFNDQYRKKLAPSVPLR